MFHQEETEAERKVTCSPVKPRAQFTPRPVFPFYCPAPALPCTPVLQVLRKVLGRSDLPT